MNKTQILIALVILSLVGICGVYIDLNSFLDAKEAASKPRERKVKHGEHRQYTRDKRLKTIVNYDQGIKHGVSYLYHDDGKTVLLAMPYEQGKREGVSKKYFKNGSLYASTNYRNDRLHGMRKLYYSSGQVKAELNYGYGHVGMGTKEYLMDGELKEAPEIVTRTEGNKVWLNTSVPCKRAIFYVGKLVDDTYLDPISEDVKVLMDSDNNYYVDTNVYTSSYLKYQDIICSCESSQGNQYILKTRLEAL